MYMHLDFELPVWQVAVNGVPLLHRHPLDGQNGFDQQHVRNGIAHSLEAGKHTQSNSRPERAVLLHCSVCVCVCQTWLMTFTVFCRR